MSPSAERTNINPSSACRNRESLTESAFLLLEVGTEKEEITNKYFSIHSEQTGKEFSTVSTILNTYTKTKIEIK